MLHDPARAGDEGARASTARSQPLAPRSRSLDTEREPPPLQVPRKKPLPVPGKTAAQPSRREKRRGGIGFLEDASRAQQGQASSALKLMGVGLRSIGFNAGKDGVSARDSHSPCMRPRARAKHVPSGFPPGKGR